MNNPIRIKSFLGPPIATGPTLWLTWFFAVLHGFVTFTNILWIVFGSGIFPKTGILAQPSQITVWVGVDRLVDGLFLISCVGVLMRSRHLASMAVVLASIIVVRLIIDAGINIFHGNLYLGDFIAPLVYTGFVIDIKKILRGQVRDETVPSGS